MLFNKTLQCIGYIALIWLKGLLCAMNWKWEGSRHVSKYYPSIHMERPRKTIENLS
jgi:hypothetical protein